MKFTIISGLTIISYISTLAAGLTIPDQTNSVSGPRLARIAHRASLDDPPITITCTGQPIDYVQAQTAATYLGNWCSTNGAIPGSSKVGFVEGKTRVYGCNWSTGRNNCSHEEVVRAQNAIASKCGLNMGGWWYRADWEKTYGNDEHTQSWCAQLREVQPQEGHLKLDDGGDGSYSGGDGGDGDGGDGGGDGGDEVEKRGC